MRPPKVTEELVDSDMVNARNLAQILWSLAKLGNPEPSAEKIRGHPEKGLREIGPLKFGTADRGTGSPPLVVETPVQVTAPRRILLAWLKPETYRFDPENKCERTV